MAQSPKGRLIQGLYKPIHGNCAIYFYPGVVEASSFLCGKIASLKLQGRRCCQGYWERAAGINWSGQTIATSHDQKNLQMVVKSKGNTPLFHEKSRLVKNYLAGFRIGDVFFFSNFRRFGQKLEGQVGTIRRRKSPHRKLTYPHIPSRKRKLENHHLYSKKCQKWGYGRVFLKNRISKLDERWKPKKVRKGWVGGPQGSFFWGWAKWMWDRRLGPPAAWQNLC